MLEAENGHIILHMSPAGVPHMKKVYSIVRHIHGRSPTDDLNDLDVNTATWGKFLNVTLQAAVHLGQDFLENLRFTKNQLLKSVRELFQVTEKLIKNQREMTDLTTIDYKQHTWRSTTLLCDKAIVKHQHWSSFKPRKTRQNGIWKLAISKKWIKSMENR